MYGPDGAIAEQEGRINMRGLPKGGAVVTVMTMTPEDEMISRLGGNGAMDPLAQVRAYWEGLREEGGIPLRAQISPRGIESALSSTFLIERIAPGMARFRIAGMGLTDLMGMDVRGMPLSALFTPDARRELGARLEQVFATPTVLTVEMVAVAGMRRPALTARLLLLPLRDEAGRLGLALGCIALSGAIGRSPRRFDIGRAALTKLERPTPQTPGIARPSPARPNAAKGFAPQVVASAAPRAFAEAGARFAPARDAKPRPYLRLVK